MRYKSISKYFVLACGLVLLASCATQPVPSTGYGYPGFFQGLLHGLTLPIALVAEIFLDFRIYAYPNSGFFYDLGFFIGIGGLSGVGFWHKNL